MIIGICAIVAKPSKRPTAFKTDPSMIPVGGTANPATIKPIDVERVSQKANPFRTASFLLIV